MGVRASAYELDGGTRFGPYQGRISLTINCFIGGRRCLFLIHMSTPKGLVVAQLVVP